MAPSLGGVHTQRKESPTVCRRIGGASRFPEMDSVAVPSAENNHRVHRARLYACQGAFTMRGIPNCLTRAFATSRCSNLRAMAPETLQRRAARHAAVYVLLWHDHGVTWYGGGVVAAKRYTTPTQRTPGFAFTGCRYAQYHGATVCRCPRAFGRRSLPTRTHGRTRSAFLPA